MPSRLVCKHAPFSTVPTVLQTKLGWTFQSAQTLHINQQNAVTAVSVIDRLANAGALSDMRVMLASVVRPLPPSIQQTLLFVSASCPNKCSGHGKCVSISQMASEPNAMPIGPNTYKYGGNEGTTTWDEDKIYGCVCDSSWTVRLSCMRRKQIAVYDGRCSALISVRRVTVVYDLDVLTQHKRVFCTGWPHIRCAAIGRMVWAGLLVEYVIAYMCVCQSAVSPSCVLSE